MKLQPIATSTRVEIEEIAPDYSGASLNLARATSVPELTTLSEALHARHGAPLMGVACLLHLTARLIKHYGAARGQDMSGLMKIQRECAEAWAHQHGHDDGDVESAFDDLTRAQATADYLAALPE